MLFRKMSWVLHNSFHIKFIFCRESHQNWPIEQHWSGKPGLGIRSLVFMRIACFHKSKAKKCDINCSVQFSVFPLLKRVNCFFLKRKSLLCSKSEKAIHSFCLRWSLLKERCERIVLVALYKEWQDRKSERANERIPCPEWNHALHFAFWWWGGGGYSLAQLLYVYLVYWRLMLKPIFCFYSEKQYTHTSNCSFKCKEFLKQRITYIHMYCQVIFLKGAAYRY